MAREITYNNFEISLVVFMLNITTNHAITYTHLLREYLIIFVISMSVQSEKFVIFFSNGQYQCAIRRVSRLEWYPNVSLFPDVLCNNSFQCHRLTQNTFQERYTLLCFTSNQCTIRP